MDGRTTRRREKDGSSIALARWWYLTGFEKTSSRRWRSQWPTTWAFGCCLDKFKKGERWEGLPSLWKRENSNHEYDDVAMIESWKKSFQSLLLYEVWVFSLHVSIIFLKKLSTDRKSQIFWKLFGILQLKCNKPRRRRVKNVINQSF